MNRLKLLVSLVRSGHAIGRVAGLSNEELSELVPNDNLTFSESPTNYQEILTYVNQFDLVEIQRQLGLILRAHSPLEAYEDVICPLLHEVGRRWQGGNLTVGQEHAISAVVIQLLSGFPSRGHGKTNQKPVIFSTLEREIHEIGSLMAAHIASDNGYPVINLGPNTPVDQLADIAHKTYAKAIAISLVYSPISKMVLSQLEELQGLLPVGCELWLGGQAAQIIPSSSNVRVFWSLSAFDRHLRERNS